MRELTITCPACKGKGTVNADPDEEEFSLDDARSVCGGEGWLDVEVHEDE